MHMADMAAIPAASPSSPSIRFTALVMATSQITVMMKQAREAGCQKVWNGMAMMLFQALIAIRLYTGKDVPVDYMKQKLGI